MPLNKEINYKMILTKFLRDRAFYNVSINFLFN